MVRLPPRDSLGGHRLSRRRPCGSLFGRFLLPGGRPRRLILRHPGWWTSTPSATSSSQPFQGHDRFFDLLTLCAQLGQHLVNVHSFIFPPKI